MSDLDSIGVTFEGNSAPLQNAANQAADAVERLGEASSSAMSAGENSPDKAAAAFEQLAAKCAEIAGLLAGIDLSQIAAGISQLADLKGPIEGLDSVIRQLNTQLGTLDKMREDLQKGFSDLRNEFSQHAQVSQTLEASIKSLRDEIQENTISLQNLTSVGNVSAATQQKIAQSLETTAGAASQTADATKKTADIQSDFAKKAELAEKSVHQLRQQLLNLKAAYKEAFSRNDTAKMEYLEHQIKLTNSALREATKEANLTKAAYATQAQAGMQLANNLADLAGKAKSGSLSMGDLASGIIAVSVAIKSGLGPIGWIMTAIQLLSVAIEKFSGSQEKAAESTKKAYDELRKLNDELGKCAVAVAKAAANEIDSQTDKQIKSIKRLTESKLKFYDRDAQAERDRTAADVANMEKRYAQREQELKQMVELGKISETKAQQEIDTMNRTLSERKALAEKREREIQQGRLDIIREGQEQEAKLYKDASQKFEDKYGKEFFTAYTDKIDKKVQSQLRQAEQLGAKIKALEQERNTTAALLQKADDAGNDRMEKFYQNELDKIDGKISAAKASLRGVESRTRNTLEPVLKTLKDSSEFAQVEGANLIKAVLEVRKIRDSYQDKITETTDALFDNETAARSIERQAELSEKGVKTQEEINASKKRTEDAALAIEQREKRWEVVQRQSYKEQEEWLEELLSHLQTGTDAHAKWTKQLQEVREKALDHEWKMVKAGWTLENQQRWLVEQMDKMEEGSVLWSKYNEKLVKINSKLEGALGSEIEGICKELKASRDYTKQTKRTEEEIFKADKKILEERLDRLRRLQAKALQEEEPDPEGLRQINDAIAHTEEEMRGLQAAAAASAAEARKWIKALEPPKLEAAKKGTQKHLENLAKSYQNAAKRFNRAAAKGNTNGMERARHSMDMYAKSMERLSKRPHEIAKYHEEVTSKTRIAASASDKTAKEENRNAAATKRKAVANEKAAKEAERDAKQAQKANDKLIALDSKIDGVKSALGDLSKSTAKLNSNMGQLAPLIGQVVQHLTECASATASAVRGIKGELASIQQQINRINAKL